MHVLNIQTALHFFNAATLRQAQGDTSRTAILPFDRQAQDKLVQGDTSAVSVMLQSLAGLGRFCTLLNIVLNDAESRYAGRKV